MLSRFCVCGLIVLKLLAPLHTLAQLTDSVNRTVVRDSLPLKKHNPKKATLYSAVLPGLGQAYNRKYWKIPIVYAAIGIPAYTFFYNKTWYQRTRDAAQMLSGTPPDTANYKNRVNEQLWVFFTARNGLPTLLNYRNQYRKDMDYSVLIMLLLWGLNVVDATVDGHLRDFEVGDNLSLRFQPQLFRGNTLGGMSMVLSFGKNPRKPGFQY